MLEVISEARTKKAPIQAKAPTCKWRATMPRPMSNLKQTLRVRWQNGHKWRAPFRSRRRVLATFSSDSSEHAVRRRPHQRPHRPRVVGEHDELSIRNFAAKRAGDFASDRATFPAL